MMVKSISPQDIVDQVTNQKPV